MLVAAALLASGTAALAEGLSPDEMLVKMSEAARAANYQGVIVYRTPDRLETLRVTHRFRDGVEVERIQTLTGTPSEILKQDGKIICLLPKDQKVTLERPTPKALFPGLSAERVAQIGTVYRFEAIGNARIAGRNCTGVAITPRDEFRYGYQIWADEQTRVPLKVNLTAGDGSVIEQMMFTEVEFPEAIPDSAFRIDVDPEKYQRITQFESLPASGVAPGSAAAELGGRFRALAPGFRVTMRNLRPSADGKSMVEQLVLSDGLTAISVFSVRRAVSVQDFEALSQIGAVHAFGRIRGRVHITVVGEAPPQTVRLIGESVQTEEGGAEPPGTQAMDVVPNGTTEDGTQPVHLPADAQAP